MTRHSASVCRWGKTETKQTGSSKRKGVQWAKNLFVVVERIISPALYMTESGIRRQKLSNRLRNRNFFVGTLWRRATFRVSGEKFLISFWRRFFFLWLRFFLFARNKKKEMNKNSSLALSMTRLFLFFLQKKIIPENFTDSLQFL